MGVVSRRVHGEVVLEQNSNINMKVALFAVVLLAAVLALAHAAFIPKDIDVASLDPHHAKILLALAQHKCANASEAECRAFFEPAPFDHCCKVWDNVKCGEKIYKCVKDCQHGLQDCITCLGPMWDKCCCCLDNAGIHGLPCPSCCSH